jgi:hypothetical protein
MQAGIRLAAGETACSASGRFGGIVDGGHGRIEKLCAYFLLLLISVRPRTPHFIHTLTVFFLPILPCSDVLPKKNPLYSVKAVLTHPHEILYQLV